MNSFYLKEEFMCDNIKEAIENKKIHISNDYLMMYLYSDLDGPSYEMLLKYGNKIQNQLGHLEIFTYYSYDMIKKWGNFPGRTEILNNYVEVNVNAVDHMNSIKESYLNSPKNKVGIRDKNNPCVILVNAKNGNFYYFEIDIKDFETQQQKVRYIYHSIEKIISCVLSGINDNICFSEITKRIRNNLSKIIDCRVKFVSNSLDMDYKDADKSIRQFIRNYLKSDNGRLVKSEKMSFDALGIKSLGLDKSFDERFRSRPQQPLTRDEAIVVAFTMGMSGFELDDFLELTNNSKLRNTKRDAAIFKILNEFIDKSVEELVGDNGIMKDFINSQLKKYGNFQKIETLRLN